MGKTKEQTREELIQEINYWEEKLKELAREPIGTSIAKLRENQRTHEAILKRIKKKRELFKKFFCKDDPTPIEDGSYKPPLH